MQYQLDLGNLAVGIGTTFLAVASFWSIHHGHALHTQQEKANWQKNLRELVARYHAACFKLSNLRRPLTLEEKKSLGSKESTAAYIELIELKSAIILMLDDDKGEHKNLLGHCHQLQNDAFEGATISAQKLTDAARKALHA